MKPALLLVDLQNDFLAADGLEPPAEELVRSAARLLEGCRTAGAPVIHVRTTVSRNSDDRMPHWRAAGRWDCVEGTTGHEFPEPLRPRAEVVIDKTFYSGFSAPRLGEALREVDVQDLILCGVHLHACVRDTALGAYERGFRVWIAKDAAGSYDAVHAEITRRWLEPRAARFTSVDELLAGM